MNKKRKLLLKKINFKTKWIKLLYLVDLIE